MTLRLVPLTCTSLDLALRVSAYGRAYMQAYGY
jgi:hypothetical protein